MATKIDIISGFLGAGKTTLIKKLLKEVVDKYHPDRILIEPSGVGKLSDCLLYTSRCV